MKKNNFVFWGKIIVSLFVFAFLSFLPKNSEAATMFLVSNTSNVSTGNIFSVRVLVNTDGQFINNAEGLIQFPADTLEVVSVEKSSSIFSLWVEGPSFSNTLGSINFNGGLATPGYNGSSGLILSVTFRTKKQGSANILFSDGSVRANDGLGTEVLTAKNSTNINIISSVVAEPITKQKNEKGELPPKPIVISSTHPNQDLWYQETTASFNWQVPNGVTAIQTLLDKSPNSVPKIIYDRSVSQKTISGIKEGISYFHIRFQNTSGWGSILNFKVKIDSSSPNSFSPSVVTENGKNIIKLDATDTMSGISYYQLQIDGAEIIKVKEKDLVNNEYTLPIEVGGKHNLVIVAYDQAGNSTKENVDFTSPTITSPFFSTDTKEIKTGGSITISGKTDYLDANVEVTVSYGNNILKKYDETPSQNGTFSFVTDPFGIAGTVSIYAENIFTSSTKSKPSEKIYIKVEEKEITGITWNIVRPIVIIASEILFISLISFLIYLGWHKFFGFRRRTRQELKNTTKSVHKSLILLKEELDHQLQILEKVKEDRSLNKKEEKIFSDIKKNIDDIDNFIVEKLDKMI